MHGMMSKRGDTVLEKKWKKQVKKGDKKRLKKVKPIVDVHEPDAKMPKAISAREKAD